MNEEKKHKIFSPPETPFSCHLQKTKGLTPPPYCLSLLEIIRMNKSKTSPTFAERRVTVAHIGHGRLVSVQPPVQYTRHQYAVQIVCVGGETF